MGNLKELYDSGINIMEYIREKNDLEENSLSSILASYDLQAGCYVADLLNPKENDVFYADFVRAKMTRFQYVDKFTDELAKEINKYEYNSVLEAGVGEATTFVHLLKKLKNQNCKAKGFDISPSRIKVAKGFTVQNDVKNAEFFVGSLEKIPLSDNAFDIVYTVHAVEPNSNNEKKIIEELYRITNKYLILVEPSYELGNDETKQNIEKHKYVKNLKRTVGELGFKVLKYELFPVGTYRNQPAIIVIEKIEKTKENSVDFCCPICKSKLEFVQQNYFCNDCNLVYPILNDIPILNSESAIIFSKFKD